MRRDPDSRRRLARAAIVMAVCVVAVVGVVATTPLADAQSGSPEPIQGREPGCLPGDGRNFTVGDGNPHIDVTVHTSLFTDPSPPSALGLTASGVALDADIVELRTGVLLETTPSGLSPDAVWDAFVVLFDYRLSLPMFDDSVGESVYEPTDGPVSGVETRGC